MGARTVLDKLIEAGEQHPGPAPQRAIGLPSLGPYLPTRRLLRRIIGGLAVLAKVVWKAGGTGLRWVAEPPKPDKPQSKEGEKPKGHKEEKKDDKAAALDALESAGAAVLAVVIGLAAAAGVASTLWMQIAPYARTAGGVAVVLLLTTAWIVGPKEPKAGEPDPSAAGGEAQPEPAPIPQDAEPLTADTVAAAVRQLATPRGWKGAHLDDVLALLPGRSREELLEVLATASIPVAEQLKLTLPGGRQRNRQGVRLAHLPQPPAEPAVEAPPEAPVEAAPEPAPPAACLTVYGAE